MKIRFKLTFKSGPNVVATVDGVREVDGDIVTVQDVTEGVIAAEQLLEKLTGLRVHIEQVA